ncbi:MAG: hypothetical protein JWN48_2048 [Myxococcaceae bacterium]|nr:hypothetical protein [Myxococcaceae bacterium]
MSAFLSSLARATTRFDRLRSGHGALLLCGVALSLSAVACGSEDPAPRVDDQSASNEGDEETPTGSTHSDAGSKPSVKDAGATKPPPSNTGTSDAGAGAGDKTPTGATGSGSGSGSGSKSLFCDALTVIQDKCQSCHTTPLAAGAPMPLVTYEDFQAQAKVTKGKKVYEVVSTRVHDPKSPMPAAAPLSAAELAPIDAWIAAGAPAGDDPTCAGKPVTPPADTQVWPPPGCEKSYKITAGNGTAVSVPAGQETHPQFTFDAPWGDAKVQAIAFRPITDNAKVLHHWILNGQGGTAAFIKGWAPGQDASLRKPLPDDVGIYLPSGKAVLRLDMHYNNLQGSAAELDQSGVEVCVTSTPRPTVATTFTGFGQLGIFLPPGQETDVVGTCNVAVKQPVFLMTESPHAHKLATHMKLEVKRNGVSTVLHDSAFTFDAQISTPLPMQVELKAGDQVITTCHYKNDTKSFVTFGENTGNEMCFNFASYYPMGALSCNGQAPIDIGKVFGGGTP